jgi:drug/metabolite transporter (DMT)-like permease
MFLNALANMLGRRSATRVDPLLHLAYAFAIGASILLPFTLHDWQTVGLRAMRSDGWWSLFYLVVPSTIIAYPCFFYGLSKMSLSSGSLPVYAVAPLTLVLSALLLHEPLTIGRILATGIVVFGLLLASPRKWKKEKEELEESAAEYTQV